MATSASHVADRATPRRAMVAAIGVVAGALVAGGAMWLALRPTPNTTLVRFEVAAPPKTEFTIQPSFSISPDGGTLAFATGGSIASERLMWIRPLGSTVARPVSGTESVSTMVWSPGSESLVFTAGAQTFGAGDGRLRKVDLLGSPPITLAEYGIAGAWSREGGVLFRGRDGRVYQIAENGGEARPVTELDKARREVAHHASFFLPDGRRFVFQAQSAEVSQSALYLSSLDDSTRVKLLDGLVGALYAEGHVFFQREGTLLVRAFDPQTGRLGDAAMPIAEDVGQNRTSGRGAFSLSENGVLVYQKRSGSGTSTLTWVDEKGRPVGTVSPDGDYSLSRPGLSADGKRLAVTRREGGRTNDVWVVDLDRNVPTRFTFDEADDDGAIFTPDGSRIVYRSNRKGQLDLYVRGSGGVGADQILDESEGAKRPTGFSPDGSILLFVKTPPGRTSETWALPMKEGSKPVALVSTGFSAGNAVFSPNGRWFAYCEGDSGSDQVYVQPYPPTGARIRLSRESGSSPQWSADGKTVYFTRSDNHVIAVDVAPEGSELRAGDARELFLAPGTFDHRSVLADTARKRFLVPVPHEQVTAGIDVVLNWQALLKGK